MLISPVFTKSVHPSLIQTNQAELVVVCRIQLLLQMFQTVTFRTMQVPHPRVGGGEGLASPNPKFIKKRRQDGIKSFSSFVLEPESTTKTSTLEV
jgi:hypothetical protein